jgi:hypothetical protein
VSENGAENFKMAERTSMFTIALFGTALQKRMWIQTCDKTDFVNRRFRIPGLTAAMGMSIGKVDNFIHGELGVTI